MIDVNLGRLLLTDNLNAGVAIILFLSHYYFNNNKKKAEKQELFRCEMRREPNNLPSTLWVIL
tara:strand:- start:1186 stop:1374 length:189 start_codon:yes stop_codon:yes gene_type:complete